MAMPAPVLLQKSHLLLVCEFAASPAQSKPLQITMYWPLP
jgi:hypothetical protein